MALKSNQVVVFPSTKTQSINKLITENSLTRLINRLIDKNSYIISYSDAWANLDTNQDIEVSSQGFDSSKEFEFCINGYYIGVNSLNSIMEQVNWNTTPRTEGDRLVARIYIDDTNPKYPEIYGQYNIVPVDYATIIEDQFVSGESILRLDTTNYSYDQVQDLVLINRKRVGAEDVDTIISNVGAVSLNTNNGKVICNDFISGYQPSNVTGYRYSILTDYPGLHLAITQPNVEPIFDEDDLPETYFDLDLLWYFTPTNRNIGTYIPLSSLHRFNASSVSTIDGGELPVHVS